MEVDHSYEVLEGSTPKIRLLRLRLIVPHIYVVSPSERLRIWAFAKEGCMNCDLWEAFETEAKNKNASSCYMVALR